MRKIILLFILFSGFAFYSDGQTPNKWDQNLQIKKFEYQIKQAKAGKYTVSINYFDYGYYKNQAPRFFRIVSFSNYGRANQKLSIEMVNLDNQGGEIEVSTIDWRENNK